MTGRIPLDDMTSDQLDALYDERDRLRAGEEDGYDPLTVPTPGQWIARWNRGTAWERLEVAHRAIDNAQIAGRCFEMAHEARLADDRKAWVIVERVRDVVGDMERITGARHWARILRTVVGGEQPSAAVEADGAGYCPACGRGDCTPTPEAYEQQRRRAAQAEELLRVAHETSNRSEAERARAVQRAEQAEAAVARVCALHREEYGSCEECTNSHTVLWPCPTIQALDEPAVAPAATEATGPREHCGHQLPDTLTTSPPTPPTECVLRPGHQGSHADDRGCRWWPANETPEQPTPVPKGMPTTGLVVQPYRTDRGEHAWVFRCWGTDDGCDGWLSLDHASQQSAERARDRHITEAHKEQQS